MCGGCGRATAIASPSEPPPTAGPYRTASSASPVEAPREAPCPYCGNACPALVRICPHCDVRLDSVRCDGCFSLQPPGSFACVRCGKALELEPLLDATDAPCPRCESPLECAQSDEPDARVQECPRCGGMFIPRHVLADILSRAELAGPLRDSGAASFGALEPVTYLRCPLCHSTMNRVNFGRISGVIVDVCREHGTWFDAGELTRVVAFAASGGLERAREREREARKESAVAAKSEPRIGERRVEFEDRLTAWRDFLEAVLW